MKVYISGPITGKENYMERFRDAQKHLEEKGLAVVNPAFTNATLPAQETSYEDYMKISFTLLDICDAIYMLEGWQWSRGARRELRRAKKAEKIVWYQKNG